MSRAGFQKRSILAVAALLLGATGPSVDPAALGRRAFGDDVRLHAYDVPLSSRKLAEIRSVTRGELPDVEIWTAFKGRTTRRGAVVRVAEPAGRLVTAIGLDGDIREVVYEAGGTATPRSELVGRTVADVLEASGTEDESAHRAARHALLYYYAAFSRTESLLVALAEETRVYLPIPPAPEYLRRRQLMAEGMMPNYQAAWYALRRHDPDGLRRAVSYLSRLAREMSRFHPPTRGGSVGDFELRTQALIDEAGEFALRTGPGTPRSVLESRLGRIYNTCQSCHDVYAPEEATQKRKYVSPL